MKKEGNSYRFMIGQRYVFCLHCYLPWCPHTAGTDDDLPPHQNTIPKGERVVGNGRSVVGSAAYSRMHTDMEAQIHHLEQEAYSAVLRAFKAQSDAISWVSTFSIFAHLCVLEFCAFLFLFY